MYFTDCKSKQFLPFTYAYQTMRKEIKVLLALADKTIEQVAAEIERSDTLVSLVLNGKKTGYAIRPRLAAALNTSESKLNRLIGGKKKGVPHAKRSDRGTQHQAVPLDRSTPASPQAA